MLEADELPFSKGVAKAIKRNINSTEIHVPSLSVNRSKMNRVWNTECQVLYLLDSQGESLWELDRVCENSDVKTEILWQRAEGSSDVLVILQKERENQNVISTKEYETVNMSSYRQVPIQ
jgi:hypothetical protein